MILELLGLFIGKSIVKQVDKCAEEIENLSDEEICLLEQLFSDEEYENN